MLAGSCSKNLEYVSPQKKRKRRGRLLYSSKRELQRSRMRGTKQMTRLIGVENSVAMKIDFGSEEVTNLASLQEVLMAEEAFQSAREDNSSMRGGKTTVQIVSHNFMINILRCTHLTYPR
jgi:hypothetical protein